MPIFPWTVISWGPVSPALGKAQVLSKCWSKSSSLGFIQHI